MSWAQKRQCTREILAIRRKIVIAAAALSALPNGSLQKKSFHYLYDKIRDSEDIEAISKCSGFSELEIKEIKDHVFFDEHILYEGTGRFTPSLDMAIAWERLSDGKPEDRDILLLRHELLESKVEKEYNIGASEAHAIAKEKFDWETVLFDLFEEEGEPYDLL